VIDRYAAEILDPNKGYLVVRQPLERTLVDTYREECRRFTRRSRVLHTRLNRPDMYDYVHPRTVLPDGTVVRSATPASLRIYQFPHNHRSPAGQQMFATLTGLRDQIEASWEHDARYRAERVEWHDFVQVTRFFDGRSGLPKHSDYSGPRTQPFLQAFMFLSRPGVDFHGGDMTLFPARGPSVRVLADLDLEQGDLLFFDRSLFHEVEPTAASTVRGVGRWSVVLARDRWIGEYWDRVRYDDFYVRHIAPRRRLNRLITRLLRLPPD
jgi:hypothetical protein